MHRKLFRERFVLSVLILLLLGTFSSISFAAPARQGAFVGEASTPFQESVLKAIEARRAQGQPVPSTVTISTRQSQNTPQSNQSILSQPLSSTSERTITTTSTLTIQFDGPEQAGYEKWPELGESVPSLGEEGAAPIELDPNKLLQQQLGAVYPGATTDTKLGYEPRVYNITEVIESHYPNTEAADMVAPHAAGVNPSDDVLMGFTYVGPQIWYGIEQQIKSDIGFDYYVLECTSIFDCKWVKKRVSTTIEVLYFKVGFQLAWGLGVRLPAFANLTGPTNATAGSKVTLSTALTTKDWDPAKYHQFNIWSEEARCRVSSPPSTCDREGHEFLMYFTFFVGFRFRLLGFDPCAGAGWFVAGCSPDENYDFGETFVTPLGGTFPLPKIEIPLDKLFAFNIKDIIEISPSAGVQASLGGKELLANWRASSNCAADKTGTVSYQTSGANVNIGPIDVCDDTTVTLDNFRYVFSKFDISLSIKLSFSVFGYGLWELERDIVTLKLDEIFPNFPSFESGGHVYCTTASIVTGCPRMGPANKLVHMIEVDKCSTNPGVTHSLAGAAGQSNWYSSNVSATLSKFGTKAECDVAVKYEFWWDVFCFFCPDRSYTGPIGFSEEGGHEFTYWGVSSDGKKVSQTTVEFLIDKTIPNLSYTFAPGAPNANGWYKDNVRVDFVATDPLMKQYADLGIISIPLPSIPGSGIAYVTPPRILSTDGTNQKVRGDARDRAGNVATILTTGINIDRTAPNISGNLISIPNSNGWFNSNVTVSFTATDALSGVASVTPDQVVMNEGEDLFVVGTATDKAGNSASALVDGIKVDKTMPSSSHNLDGTMGSGGWYVSNVTATLFASDPAPSLGVQSSGLHEIEYSLDGFNWLPYSAPLELSEGVHTLHYRAVDLASNVENTHVVEVKVDTTAPEITGAPTTLPDSNGEYVTDVIVQFAAFDSGSGIASVSPTATLTENGSGQTVVGTAFDVAGNSASVTVGPFNINKPGPCTSDPSHLSGHITTQGGEAVGWITNNGAEAFCGKVGLASYRMFDNNIDNQQGLAFDNPDNLRIEPGEKAELRVSMAECSTQIDLFHGDVIWPTFNGQRYLAQGRLLDASIFAGNGFCVP